MTNPHKIIRDIIGHNNRDEKELEWQTKKFGELKFCTDCHTPLKKEGKVKFCPNCENVY